MIEQELIFGAQKQEEYNNIDWISEECSGSHFADKILEQHFTSTKQRADLPPFVITF